MRHVILIGLALTALQSSGRAPGSETIQQSDLKADLFFLAGDTMRGRLTDTAENRIAVDWVKSRFERMGLKPGGTNGTYYHEYNLMSSTLADGNSLKVSASGQEQTLTAMQDFYPQTFSAAARVRGGAVFAGFGITSPDLGYDDYRSPEIRGKVVLIVDHEPGERDMSSPFDGVVTAEAAGPLRKALAAQDKGAAGVLFVSDVHNHPEPVNFEIAARTAWPPSLPRIRRFTLSAWADRLRIPAFQISPAAADLILKPSGRTLLELSRSAEAPSGISAIVLPGVEVEMQGAVTRHTIPDRSAVAMLEGSDPRLKNEYVLISGHLDHEGAGAGNDQIFNGADDNGSGTVGLVEVAEAYAAAAKAGRRPRRSIIFASWNSEERGLLGAWAYTEAPAVPLNRIVAVLNMDMIGRNEEVVDATDPRFRGLDPQTSESNNNATNIIGSTRSADLKAAVTKANQSVGLDLRFRYDNNISNLMRRSDQWPFLNRGVPGLWFHTGLHPDYHTIRDRPERINYVKMEKVVRLVHQMSWDLAQQDERPELIRLRSAAR